ncbi:hypothetical protein V8B55DRAFT_1536870 [Mucor lusitanicus]|uniref:RING-type domain-containing protein n=1 Tax=Mucor lusitanicus CBS 277.49 TaxID=747725 RepID=A0A168QH17_MUCCL|nr:hypothetical protein MUCCIDRAFT_106212 [Mucor lusitanicus CBS 277.49]
MASPPKDQHYSNQEQPRKRSKVSRRELDTLNDNNSNRAHRDLPKCPVCEYRIDPKYWAEHYQYELNRLSEPSSEAYANPVNKNHGKRGAAVAARRQLEGSSSKGKKKTSVHQETLEKIQKNRHKRKDRLKQIIDSNSYDPATATASTSSSTADDSHHVALMLQQEENDADVQTCFICQQRLFGDLEDINRHIDHCLSNPTAAAMETSDHQEEEEETEEEEEEAYVDDDEDYVNTNTPAQQASPASWEEYEWAGQVRVRASAMMEGGYGGAGFATASKVEVVDEDDEDLDVEDDDAAQFGESQYTERDIVVNMDDNNENDSALREMVSGGSVRTPTSEGDQQRQEFEATVSVSGWDQHLKKESHYTTSSSSKNQSSLVIDSLKARIHELESASKSSNCLICLENYKTPLTSIVCWHVHCEQCWLHTLGTKKLCPQCQKITTPADLRRIYL